ncbi:ABC transporter substrate-binding protein [Methanosarcina acetivorans]|nr:ABC transporter substrate-binding protein [Methanosarcina acetivorans]
MYAMAGGLLFVFLGVLLAGCISEVDTDKANNHLTREEEYNVSKLVIGVSGSMTEIQMNLKNYVLTNYLSLFTNEGFIEYDENGSVVTRLAKSWETNDSKRYVIHLVENATWNDGVPFTSEDVKFTFDYMEKNSLPAGESFYKMIDSIETPDEHTVVINLKNTDATVFSRRSVLPFTIPEHIFKDVESLETFSNTTALFTGTGPYVFDGYDQSAGIIRFKANENYWGGIPAIGELEIKFYKNYDTLMMAFEKGEVDVPFVYASGINYYYVPKLLKNEQVKIMSYDSKGINSVLYFNNNRTPYDIKEYRQAISYAIDFEELRNLMTAGYGYTPNAGMVLEGMPYYIETRPLSYDLDKSKELLDSIGFKDVDGDGFRETADGRQLKPELLVVNNVNSERTAQLLKKYFNDAGLSLEINIVDDSTLWTLIEENRDYDMSILSAGFWTTFNYRGYYTSVVDSRRFGWANVVDPNYLSLVDQLGTATDSQTRAMLVKDLQNYYADNMTQIPLYTMDYIQPYNKKYEGYVPNPVWGILSLETYVGLHEAA